MSRKNIYLELVGKLERKLCGMLESSMLPPEQQLAEELGVSKPTLRRALDAMLDAGQIRKVNGVGVFVVKCEKAISREIIFLCHDIVFFAETLKSFGEVAALSNYFMSIVPLSGDAKAQERLVASVAARRPAGVVVYGDPRNDKLAAFHQLAEYGIPAVYLIRLPHGIDSNLATFGNADGITEIVETFYNDGCRRIALYGDAMVNPAAGSEREQGFLAGMKKCRLKPHEELWCPHDADAQRREAFLQLLSDADKRPDAICCLNDYCVGALVKALLRRGVDISKIRFSGFDHSPLSEFIPVDILTVEPPMHELGIVSAKLLIRQIENPDFAFQRKKLKAHVLTTRGVL